MCRKQVEVVGPVFTKHESLRLKARDGNGEHTIHEVIDPFDVLMQPSVVGYNLRVAIKVLVISILASFHYDISIISLPKGRPPRAREARPMAMGRRMNP
jgi:hypothetical protein